MSTTPAEAHNDECAGADLGELLDQLQICWTRDAVDGTASADAVQAEILRRFSKGGA